MNLYQEARTIAQEAIEAQKQYGQDPQEYIHETCDMHEIAIYYGKAIDFCATHDTDAGEQWLEDCGGIAQPGDSFGNIACRIAYATLLCACEKALAELINEAGEAA